jgi:hypothetical protein
VEAPFDVGVGRSLVTGGLIVENNGLVLTDRRRRRAVTGVADVVIGFQHG